MDRRTLIVSGLVTLGSAGPLLVNGAKAEPIQLPPAQPRSTATPPPASRQSLPAPNPTPTYPTGGTTGTQPAPPPGKPEPYTEDEIVNNVSDFLGVTAENAGGAVERIFARNGRPTAYIAGEERSGAFAIGARYGPRLLYIKGRQPVEVHWQEPAFGSHFRGEHTQVLPTRR